MKWTSPRAIAIGALAVTAFLFAAKQFGLTDAWVSALSALLTVVVSVFAIIIPLQQETEKKRRAHLAILVNEVLTPLSNDMQQQYLATVSRNTFPLEWWPSIGLFIRSRGALAKVLQPASEPPRGLQKNRYEDVARNHYPAIIRRVEEFKRGFEEFLEALLLQAQELEKELCSQSSVRPLDGTEERLGCYHGALALYVFNRLWMKGYDFPLMVLRDTTSQDGIWLLQKTTDTSDVARGTEQEMRQFNDLVETFINSKDRAAFILATEGMDQRLTDLQDEIAKIQASEELEGNCSTG